MEDDLDDGTTGETNVDKRMDDGQLVGYISGLDRQIWW